jgi:hypothetical protein
MNGWMEGQIDYGFQALSVSIHIGLWKALCVRKTEVQVITQKICGHIFIGLWYIRRSMIHLKQLCCLQKKSCGPETWKTGSDVSYHDCWFCMLTHVFMYTIMYKGWSLFCARVLSSVTFFLLKCITQYSLISCSKHVKYIWFVFDRASSM